MTDEQELYTVVVNAEEQYSIWPSYKELPAGWRAAGKSGTKEECMAYIQEIWVDFRPINLRRNGS